MAPTESLSRTTSLQMLNDRGERATPCTIVWLRGEHDVATVSGLSDTLAEALDRDDANVIVDLRAVEFMGAATIGVLLRARKLLRLRNRTLTLRTPSAAARRIIDACGLSGVLECGPDEASAPRGALALSSWVQVPGTGATRQRDAHRAAPTLPVSESSATSQDAAVGREGP